MLQTLNSIKCVEFVVIRNENHKKVNKHYRVTADSKIHIKMLNRDAIETLRAFIESAVVT